MSSRAERRTPLTEILLERIEREGALTFAVFMEACLYHPEHGYYTHTVPGRGVRDYVTSPEVGPLYGRLLARQLREMWEVMGRPGRFQLVECGAGSGRLAEQVLVAAGEQEADFAAALCWTLVETSPQLRRQAQARLKGYGDKVRFTERLPPGGLQGCVLSNELVDALPVHRVVQRQEGLREIYVGARDDQLVEVEDELSSPEIARYLERYGAPLEEDQQAEVHLAALVWLAQAATALERGFLLTIDYGYRARELYGPAHQRGTLLAYRKHRAHEEWLAWPGEQDLTAQVNFTALETRGRELGLETLGYTPQTQFLLALARASGFADLPGADADEGKQRAARLQLKQLIHPEGMGEALKVLVQAKAVEAPALSGLQPL
ncbi:MAG: SAM-dependent methyltransferase [Candidatus Acidoferrales bacterium]